MDMLVMTGLEVAGGIPLFMDAVLNPERYSRN